MRSARSYPANDDFIPKSARLISQRRRAPADLQKHRKCKLWQFSRFPVPPIDTWPQSTKEIYHRAIRSALGRDANPWELIVFEIGGYGLMWLEDAFAPLSFLDIDPRGWGTAGGYPSYRFPAEQIPAHMETFSALGYTVFLLNEGETVAASDTRPAARYKGFKLIQGGRSKPK